MFSVGGARNRFFDNCKIFNDASAVQGANEKRILLLCLGFREVERRIEIVYWKSSFLAVYMFSDFLNRG
ncbi:hypothetical protein L596_013566 [Steinernema carpocapsae]|uniref:Uncharacterized protein n=1 Tax=Steinernema carpocapsae TaxID=34508 RepID=A0A4U5P0L2_STECR|nr:hypothetical protein L596_013566 [Steinernema carpocapsae]